MNYSKKPNYIKVNGVIIDVNETPKISKNNTHYKIVCAALLILCINYTQIESYVLESNDSYENTNSTVVYADDSIVENKETELFLQESASTTVDETKSEFTDMENVNAEPVVEDIVTEPVVEDIAATKKWTTSSLNLRTGPSTDDAICVTVPFNTELEVTGSIDCWYRVIYKGNEYFAYKAFLTDEKYVQPVVETAEEKVNVGPYDNIVIGEDGTDSVTKNANKYWNNTVPEDLKKWFVENGWQIKVSNVSLKSRFNCDYSVAGMTVWGEKTIYLDNRNTIIELAMLHEIGHAVDMNWYVLSYGEDFQTCYEKERDNFIDSTGGTEYAKTNVQEYFASVFANMILDTNAVRNQCPETVAYIEANLPY